MKSGGSSVWIRIRNTLRFETGTWQLNGIKRTCFNIHVHVCFVLKVWIILQENDLQRRTKRRNTNFRLILNDPLVHKVKLVSIVRQCNLYRILLFWSNYDSNLLQNRMFTSKIVFCGYAERQNRSSWPGKIDVISIYWNWWHDTFWISSLC